MLDDRTTTRLPLVRLPRLVPGEWRCLDCGRLSYGRSATPRCPACLSQRLHPTIEGTYVPAEQPLATAAR